MRVSRFLFLLTLFMVVLVPSTPMYAHHSVASEFNVQKMMPMTGVLTKLHLVMPHPWMFVDVKGPNGKVEHWELEFSVRWRPNLKIGETYKMVVAPSRDAVKKGFIAELQLPDGRKFSRAS